MANFTDMMQDNVTMEFNCLVRDNLSSVTITNHTPWEVISQFEVSSPILAAFYIIFFLIAFFWNLFIVVTYLTKYKLLKQPGNLFLFNLALADLLIAVTSMMFSFVAQAAREFVFGSTDVVRCGMCDFAGFFVTFLIFITFFLLAALSVDRFILLSRPLRYKRMMTFPRAMVIIIVVWVISFILSIPPFVGFGQFEFNRNFGSCIVRFSGENYSSGINNLYYVVFGIIVALIPIGTIVFTNVFTYRLVRKFLTRNIRRRRTFRSPEEQQANSEEERRHRQQQSQLVRVFGALCVANCIAWTPVILVVAVIGIAGFALASEVPNGVYIFGWICYLSNPVVHPIIESFFVKDLRYQVKRAQSTIRRASTYIIRSTTKSFKESDLDKANAAVEDGNTPPSKRTIQFFNSKKAKNARVAKELQSTSMATEDVGMDDMTSHQSTPSPHVTPRQEVKKFGRSVTFTETPSPAGTSPEGGVELKSVLKRSSEPPMPTAVQLGSLTEVIPEVYEGDDDIIVQEETTAVGVVPSGSSQIENGVVPSVGGGEHQRQNGTIELDKVQVLTSEPQSPQTSAVLVTEQPRSNRELTPPHQSVTASPRHSTLV